MLINPKMQLKYAMYYAGIAVVSLLMLNALVGYFLVELVNYSGVAEPGTGIGEIFVRTLVHNREVVAAAVGTIAMLYLIFAVILMKNVVGPVRALTRHIEELKKGNYDVKTTLRKGDELTALRDALNELSDALKAREAGDSQTKKVV